MQSVSVGKTETSVNARIILAAFIGLSLVVVVAYETDFCVPMTNKSDPLTGIAISLASLGLVAFLVGTQLNRGQLFCCGCTLSLFFKHRFEWLLDWQPKWLDQMLIDSFGLVILLIATVVVFMGCYIVIAGRLLTLMTAMVRRMYNFLNRFSKSGQQRGRPKPDILEQ